jgi:primary-amine oxidase
MWQPHGFFNCSPAVDVRPSAGDSEVKDSTTVAKLIPNNLLAKL